MKDLDDLSKSFPLPPGWKISEIVINTKNIYGFRIPLTGLVAQHSDGDEAIGSAAGFSCNSRAYFELCERIAITEAIKYNTSVSLVNSNGELIRPVSYNDFLPQNDPNASWVYAKSNGVALNKSLSGAMSSARCELIERDSILLSWYGYTLPYAQARVESNYSYLFKTVRGSLLDHYNIQVYEFPVRRKGSVYGVFCFPLDNVHPLTYGFGGSEGAHTAIMRACREAIQRLGFLWGEEIPTEKPIPAKNPFFHQDFYLYPENHFLIKNWLAGESYSQRDFPQKTKKLNYLNLTSVHFSKLGLKIIQAVPDDEFVLKFGIQDEFIEKMQVHPIV